MTTQVSKNAYNKWLLDNAQHLYDSAPFGYLVTLPNGKIYRVNKDLLLWLEYEEVELVEKKKFQDFLSVGGKIYYETHHRPLEDLQGHTREMNYTLLSKSKVRIPVLVNTKVHRNLEGVPLFTRIFIYNITDRKRYEKELLLAKKKAEEATKVKTAFLSTISHEIRTPMNAIMGTTDLLLKNTFLPEQFELLKILRFSADNLLELINNILDLSKTEANKMVLNEKNINLRQNINILINSWQARADEKGIDLVYEFDKDIPDYLVGDAVKIGQVINNLLGNALKFTHAGYVKLTIRKEKISERQITLFFSVEDTGVGIPAHHQKQIFEAFEQADASISNEFGGSGLGLAISQNIIRLYDSELKVESIKGSGSIFFFDLVLKVGQAPKIASKVEISHKERLNTLQGMKVLLVEDNESNIFIAGSYFKRWSLSYDVAKNGQIAIEKVQETDYDLVLMDLRMPVMSGYDALHAIRQLADEKYRQLPIVALSASTNEDLNHLKEDNDFNDFLLKPFDPLHMYNVLKTYHKNTTAISPPENKPKEETTLDLSTLPFSLKLLEEVMEGDEEAIQSFIPIITEDLKEAKITIQKSLKQKDFTMFKDVVHKINTITRLLNAVFLKDLLQQSKEVLLGDKTGDLNMFRESIGEAIDAILNALNKRIGS